MGVTRFACLIPRVQVVCVLQGVSLCLLLFPFVQCEALSSSQDWRTLQKDGWMDVWMYGWNIYEYPDGVLYAAKLLA